MPSNSLIIDVAKSLYLKHGGKNHREIEREIHALGCRRFTRRSLYNQKTKTGYRLGWIEKYGWKTELAENTDSLSTDQVDSLSSSSPPSRPSDSDSSSPRLGVSAVRSSPPTDFPSFLKQISPNLNWDWPYQKLIYEQ